MADPCYQFMSRHIELYGAREDFLQAVLQSPQKQLKFRVKDVK